MARADEDAVIETPVEPVKPPRKRRAKAVKPAVEAETTGSSVEVVQEADAPEETVEETVQEKPQVDYLSDLPNEILFLIAKHIGPRTRSLLAQGGTCKRVAAALETFWPAHAAERYGVSATPENARAFLISKMGSDCMACHLPDARYCVIWSGALGETCGSKDKYASVINKGDAKKTYKLNDDDLDKLPSRVQYWTGRRGRMEFEGTTIYYALTRVIELSFNKWGMSIEEKRAADEERKEQRLAEKEAAEERRKGRQEKRKVELVQVLKGYGLAMDDNKAAADLFILSTSAKKEGLQKAVNSIWRAHLLTKHPAYDALVQQQPVWAVNDRKKAELEETALLQLDRFEEDKEPTGDVETCACGRRCLQHLLVQKLSPS